MANQEEAASVAKLPKAKLQKAKLPKASYGKVIGAFLGCLGAVNMFFTAFYVLTVYHGLIYIHPMEQLFWHVHIASALMGVSAMILVYGSYLILRTNCLKGGIVNFLAGTVVPIPAIVYLAFLLEPSLLGWLFEGYYGAGFFLLVPGMVSGAIGVYMSASASDR